MLGKTCVRLGAWILAASFAVWLSGCGGSPALGPVSITVASSTVDGGDTLSLSVTVTNDQNSAGVKWSASAGTLSNTTTTSATFTAPAATSSSQTITITATSIADTTKSGTITITIPATPSVTSTGASLAGAVGTAYSVQLQASGGIAPYTWTLASGSTLPSCLTLKSTGVITTVSGVAPTASCAGTYSNLVFKVTDSGTPTPLTTTSSPISITISAPSITFPASLPGATVGTAYSASAGATGALGATTYTLNGALPASGHLAFNSATGLITGTPYKADVGTYAFTVTVSDLYGDTATSGPLSLTVNPVANPIAFGAAPAAAGTFNVAYSSAVAASGGAGTLTYGKASGNLPPDLALASNGVIAGTPKAADIGAWTFAVTASDAYGDSTTSGNYTITISYPTLAVTPAAPSTGYTGSAYPNLTLAATGGNGGPYSWNWAPASGSALPPGLALSAAGVVSGTPTAGSAGTYNVTVTATDNATPANSGQTTLAFTIKPGIKINSITLPTGYAGSNYPPTGGAATVSATGGTGTYTWSMTSAPSGLAINPTSGQISGTLAAGSAGSYNLAVTATDNATPANTATATLPLTIGAGVGIATNSSEPNAYPGTAYTSNLLTASGGNGGPYNWSWAAASGSSLPANFTIGAGPSATTTITSAAPVNSGSATATYNVVVTAADSLGNQTTQNLAIRVETTLDVTSPATLPGVTVGTNPNYQLTASGGSGTYTGGWSVTSGATSLAAVGLSLTSNGVLTGANPTAGTANFTVTVTDSEGHVSAPANLAVTVSNALSISTSTLLGGNAGTTYSQSLQAAGGSGTYTNWQITAGAGSLSALNLSLNATSGAITGTPSSTGTASFTAQVTDSANNKATKNLTIQVYPALSLPAPDPASLPSTAYAGYPYNSGAAGVVNGSGGSGTLTISVVSGLPADGLTAIAAGSTLSVSGTVATTPAPPYVISFTAKLTDNSTGNSIMQSSYTISVAAAQSVSLPLASASVPGTGTVGQNYLGSIPAINGVPPYTWYYNGTLVTAGGISIGDNITVTSTAGSSLTFSSSTPPTTAQTIGPFSVKVVDSANPTTNASTSYTITVNNNGGQVGGQIALQNNNCNVSSLPTYTVTATNTSTSQNYTTSTDGSGNYSFANLPAGTYSIVPTLPQASGSVFNPTSYVDVIVSNGSNITGENFGSVVGYAISGTLSYSGSAFASQGGQVYLVANNNCGNSNGNPGTSVAWSSANPSPSYTIRGVAPGTYTVQAFMDPASLGHGAMNTIDPLGSSSQIVVGAGTSGASTGVGLSLADPTFITPSSNPSPFQVIASNNAWLLNYKPPMNNNNQEEANQYVVQWATATGTDSANNPTCTLSSAGGPFATVAGSHIFTANGDHQDVWIMDNTSMGAGTFASGTAYCFQARSFNTLASTQHPGGWSTFTDSSGSPEATTPTTSTTFCASNCTTVSGTVTIPSGVAIKPGAPLYMGYFQQRTGGGSGPQAIYVTEVASPVSGGSGNPLSMTIPNGSGYVMFGILDQNNDGAIDSYDVTNVRNSQSSGTTFSGGSISGQALTLPNTNSAVRVQTQYCTSSGSSSCAQGTSGYAVQLVVTESNKLPVAVTLANTSATSPYVITPVDMGACSNCGSASQFEYYTNLPGATPGLGDSFDFTVTYSDGSQDTGTTVNGAITAFGSTGAIVGASDAATNLQASTGTTPNFTWAFPANPSNYTYQFNLYQSSNCTGNCTIWQIPGNNSNANGFTYAETQTGAGTGQITWSTDPTGGGSTPSSSLSSANNYNWYITVQDSNGNSAQSNVTDNNP